MKRIRPHSAGLVLAIFFAAWHALWSGLIALGVAQPMLDWVFRLHMIEPVYKVLAFDPLVATSLVLITAAFGYAGGFTAGVLWNRFGTGASTV